MQNHCKTHISHSNSPRHLTNDVERKGTRQNEAQGGTPDVFGLWPSIWDPLWLLLQCKEHMEINAKPLKTQISDSIPPSHSTNEVERKGTRQNEAQGKKEGIAAKGRRQKDSNAAEGRRKVHQICRLFFLTQREQAHVRKKRFESTCFFSFWPPWAAGGQKADSHIIYNI